MSGGHFNGNGYIYYQVDQFADELENEIQNNDVEDRWGYSPSLSQETLDYLKVQIAEMHRIAKIMREIDYLYSSDHSEESFMKAVGESK
jgi:hypothetical protein